MNKPTLFFSHSSKDRDAILTIKNKIDKITGGTLDIFMSSDGQSIPFGTNWIHKIEEGLKAATIMFVFVTEQSISSGWIYFEAGYAYSKGIQVIPVGIGVDIGSLKAPLNLLQGFNISSTDSLNNFISIINKKFDYRFDENFTNGDYEEIVSLATPTSIDSFDFERIIKYSYFEIKDKFTDENKDKTQYNVPDFFDQIVKYLDENNIEYALSTIDYVPKHKKIIVKGIKITYYPENENLYPPGHKNSNDLAKVEFCLSSVHFDESFELTTKLLSLLEKEKYYIRLCLNDAFACVYESYDKASIVTHDNEFFSLTQNNTELYLCKDLDLTFGLFDYSNDDRYSYFGKGVHINFNINTINIRNIFLLLLRLYNSKLIYLEQN